VTRDEAVAQLRRGYADLAPGRKVTARPFRPEDAPGVGRLFFQVYGEEYPVDDPYVPELLVEANRVGRIRTVVAETDDGDIVGQTAVFRSSAPNPAMFEYGQMLVDRNYRDGFAAFRMHQFALRNMFGRMEGVDALFGEAVCHHLSTQKLSAGTRFLPCALEIGLMPEKAYSGENLDGRASCLMQARVDSSGAGDLCVPASWRDEVEALRSAWTLDRRVSLVGPDVDAPEGTTTDASVVAFDFAGVTRVNAGRIGMDFAARLSESIRTARERGHVLLQVFLSLGDPWVGGAARRLRDEGFFFGGFLPSWFGAAGAGPDALLLQRLLAPVDIADILVLNGQATMVRDLVTADMERAGRERGAPIARTASSRRGDDGELR